MELFEFRGLYENFCRFIVQKLNVEITWVWGPGERRWLFSQDLTLVGPHYQSKKTVWLVQNFFYISVSEFTSAVIAI
jgi:hypothetical protein